MQMVPYLNNPRRQKITMAVETVLDLMGTGSSLDDAIDQTLLIWPTVSIDTLRKKLGALK